MVTITVKIRKMGHDKAQIKRKAEISGARNEGEVAIGNAIMMLLDACDKAGPTAMRAAIQILNDYAVQQEDAEEVVLSPEPSRLILP